MTIPPKCFCLFLVVLSFGLTGSRALAVCSSEQRKELYESFLTKRKANQPEAFEEAKKYLACPTESPSEEEQKIINYLKKYITLYEEEVARKIRFRKLLYEEKKYPEAYALAREILARQPDDLSTLVHAGANGYLILSLNNASLTAQVRELATRALQQLESGKNLDDWSPFLSRDETVAYLNYTVGASNIESDPGKAVTYLLKAAQSETPLQKSPYTYAYIAVAYETGDYVTQSEPYMREFAGKPETPQSKLSLANIFQTVDRMIDGYARAVALASNDPRFIKDKESWSESLRNWYMIRNKNSAAGLDQLIETILTKPLPPRPTPLTSIQ